MAEYIYEFLYRGRPTRSLDPPAWHLILGDDATGKERCLNMAQAVAAGWALPSLLTAMNTAAVTRVLELEAENTTHRARVATLEGELARAQIKKEERS